MKKTKRKDVIETAEKNDPNYATCLTCKHYQKLITCSNCSKYSRYTFNWKQYAKDHKITEKPTE